MQRSNRVTAFFFVVGSVLLSLNSCTTTTTIVTETVKPVCSEMRARRDVVNYAKQFIGTRYRYAGQSPLTGFDCAGFVRFVWLNYGIGLSASGVAQEGQGIPVAFEGVRPGDILFFSRYGRGGAITHVGLVSANTEEGIFMVHASTSRGVVEENVTTSAYWLPKLLYARNVLDANRPEGFGRS